MRRLPWSAALVVLLCALPATAQQGALQLSATTQVLTGNDIRLAGQDRIVPDLGILWSQPTFRFGVFELDAHLTQRDDELRLGRTAVGLRAVRVKGLSWSIRGGDSAIVPSISDYAFSNLFAPRLNLLGASALGVSAQTMVTVGVGRTVALRNIFGTDSDVLDQGVVFVKARHRWSPAFEISARASGVRTRDLGEFTWSIAESRQVGGGVRYRPIGLLELVGDAAYTSFRRRGLTEFEQDASALAGTVLTLPRGWVQINAQRLSPGEFPVLHNTLTDREGVFAAGEYDITGRVRIFGGVDGYETNLDPEKSAQAVSPPPRTRLEREFGGVRTRLGQRSFFTVRLEDSTRESRPVTTGRASDSDTMLVGAEWQATLGRWNTFARYARRDNADRTSVEGSFVQHDTTALVYYYPSRHTQVFGSFLFQKRDIRSGRGLNYWQATAGGQLQMPNRNLWLRAEGSAIESVDLDTDLASARNALTVGFFGQVTSRTHLAFDLYVDRAPSAILTGSPWTTRSMIRLVHSIPTGSARVAAPGTSPASGRPPAAGAGAIEGLVFADWNGNNARDEGEEPLAGIALAVGTLASVASGPDGQFQFAQVPAGLQQVGLDVTVLPVDYDVPAVAKIDIDIERKKTARVSFGLIPLGSVHGSVRRDANGNGLMDESDEPIDGAVVVIDAGARSEMVRGGAFRFNAVRAGRHVVQLLTDSLPAGAETQGSTQMTVELVRSAMDPGVEFLVKLERRPEVRKVFPPATVGATPARPTAPVVAPTPPRPSPVAPEPEGPRASAVATGAATIQLAAVGRLDRAQALVKDLRSRGFDAYIVQPPATGGDGFYRVRLGTYPTRDDARRAADAISRTLNLPLWIAEDQPPRSPAPAAATAFIVQVAALADASRAQALAQRLEKMGYAPSVTSPQPGDPDTLHRVSVGPYRSLGDARAAASAIERALGVKTLIRPGVSPPRNDEARAGTEWTVRVR